MFIFPNFLMLLAKASSPGKCILFGEHAVVYGEPGIAAPLSSCKVEAKAYPYEKGFLKLETDLGNDEGEVGEYKEFGKWLSEEWERCYKAGDFSELFGEVKKHPEKTWLGVLAWYFNLPEEFSALFKTKSTIPIGAGAGSSAAVGSSIDKCIAEIIGENDKKRIFEASLLCEKMFHGTPSGIDSAIACYGQALVFRKGKGFEFFKMKPLEVFMIYTHKPKKTTGELVQGVRSLSDDYREPRVKEIGKLTTKAKKALENGDLKELLDYVKENQRLLAELGVSSKEIDELAEIINREKDMALKLTGAGGGGLVIGFCLPQAKQKFEEILKELNYRKIKSIELVFGNKIYWEEKLY